MLESTLEILQQFYIQVETQSDEFHFFAGDLSTNTLRCKRCGQRVTLYGSSGLAGKVVNMSATCCPDSQMSAHLADMPLPWRHKIDPDSPFFVGDCQHSPNLYLSIRPTYSEFLCNIW
jgi:hypothetical protein